MKKIKIMITITSKISTQWRPGCDSWRRHRMRDLRDLGLSAGRSVVARCRSKFRAAEWPGNVSSAPELA